MGDPASDSSTQASAAALISALQAGCANFQSSNTTVSAFQQDYNAAGGSPALAVDGLYGPATQAALASVNGSAPAGCVAGASSASSSSALTNTSSGTLSEQQLVYIGLGTIVVGGAIWYFVAHHKGAKRR
jgi:hypothetical protein